MCLGGRTRVIQPEPMPMPTAPPPQPPQITVTPPPVIQQASPQKKRQARPTTQARRRRASMGGVSGKRKFMIPLAGMSTQSGSGVNY